MLYAIAGLLVIGLIDAVMEGWHLSTPRSRKRFFMRTLVIVVVLIEIHVFST